MFSETMVVYILFLSLVMVVVILKCEEPPRYGADMVDERERSAIMGGWSLV